MSTLIANNRFLDKLANELAARAEDSGKSVDTDYLFASYIREFLGLGAGAFDAPVDAFPKITEMVERLYSANVSAFNACYKESIAAGRIESAKVESLEFKRKAYWPEWSHVQTIKHLQYLLYQMAEGEVYKSDLYNKLEKLISKLCMAIVDQMPEYEKAKWGFES
jgi:hypothetical protein